MSWDRTEYVETAVCACGKGTIVRHAYREKDDWNREREKIISEKIYCDACEKKYHIEHYVRYFFQPSWEGDGVMDRAFLVPNNYTIPAEISERIFRFNLDEQIVATYCLEEILSAKSDMIRNKFSTRLERQSSKEIVKLFAKKYKKRSLSLIVELLSQIESRYEDYKWTPLRMEEYRNQEKIRIKENEQAIQDVLNQSFELSFRRNDE